MSYDTLSKYAEQCGWNLDTQIDLLCEYIINQLDDAAFEDFLKGKADEEFESADECCWCGCDLDDRGWCMDDTCTYSDWPQNTPRNAPYEMSKREVEKTYGVKRRKRGAGE